MCFLPKEAHHSVSGRKQQQRAVSKDKQDKRALMTKVQKMRI
jgi:hypothetical protein